MNEEYVKTRNLDIVVRWEQGGESDPVQRGEERKSSNERA